MKAILPSQALAIRYAVLFLFWIGLSKQVQSQSCPDNIGFENGNLNNWTFFKGACCPISANTSTNAINGRHTLTSGTGKDYYGDFPVVAPRGGNYSLKLGNASSGGEAERARFLIRVPKGVNNYSLLLSYAVVLQNPSHTHDEQPRFVVRAFDSASGTNVSCANFDFVASGSLPGFTKSKVTSNVWYKPWDYMSMNLSGAAGKTIIVDFTTADCGQGGHFGYGYFDLSCGLFEIAGAICPNQKDVTLSAPQGFSKYVWFDSSLSKSVGSGQSISFPPPKSKSIYKVIITPYSGYGCKDTLESLVDFSYLKIDTVSLDTFMCYDKKLQLVAASSDNSKYYPLKESWISANNTAACSNCNQLQWNARKSDTFYYKITNNQGCRDSARVIVKVNPLLQFSKNLEGLAACEESKTVLRIKSNEFPDLRYQWFKNDVAIDNNSDSLVLQKTTLNDSGFYRVTLFNHCDTLSSERVFLQVNPKTKISLKAAEIALCETEKLTLNQTIIGTGPFTFSWKKDRNIIAGANADSFHIAVTSYLDSGNYMAYANGSCGSDSAKISIVVHPAIHADFEINQMAQCENEQQFIFTDKSALRWGKYTYHWAESTTLYQGPSWKPKAFSPGIKKIKLVLIPQKGCADSIEKAVEVYPSPIAAIAMSDISSCYNEQHFIATNTSSITSGNIQPTWSLDHQFQNNTALTLEPKKLDPGNHTIELFITSDKGCSDTSTIQVVVHPSPLADYTRGDTQYCFSKQDFVFTDNSKLAYGNFSIRWKSSEGVMSTSTSFKPHFAKAGNATVWQTITSDKGCTDSNSIALIVHENPNAVLAANNAEQCYKEQLFVFTDNSSSTSSSLKRKWYLNQKLLQCNNEHLQLDTLIPGKYRITLIPQTQFQCEDTAHLDILVHPSPIATYTSNGLQYCEENQAFSFQDASTLAFGTLQTKWHLGDGSILAGQSISHQFKTYGKFSGRQVVVSDKGCTDSNTMPMEVYPTPVSKISSNAKDYCYNEQNFVVADVGEIAYHGRFREWRLDGKQLEDTSKSVALPMLLPGSHTVQIQNYTAHGCTDTSAFHFQIYPSPNARYEASELEFCINAQNFIFEDKSIISSGTFQTTWRLGDEAATPGNTIRKQYQKHGYYVVWQIVSSDKNCTDSVSIPVLVHPAPRAAIQSNFTAQCYKNQKFEFSDQSSIAYTELHRKWHLDNVASADTNKSIQGHNLDYGKHQITLISTSGFGCADTAEATVQVHPNPIAKHTVNDTAFCFEQQQFRFSDSSSIYNGSMRVKWEMGDGTELNGKSIFYQYNTANRYSVSHIVTSDAGCADTSFSQVLVRPQPIAKFTIDDSLSELPKFINLSSENCNYQWNFGNGIHKSTESLEAIEDIIFNFNASRSFRTKLLVTDKFGCQDTTSQMVQYRGPYIFIPNAAILNSDNRDNSFFVSCFRCRNYTLKIFNRWGQMIYVSPENEQFPVWNGQINGQPVMEGFYVYMVEVRDLSGQAYYRNGTVYMTR